MKNSILLFVMAVGFIACEKQTAWLDAKSDKADVVPSTLADLQAVLDNDNVMNKNSPALGTVGSDNYYTPFATWQSVPSKQARNAYLWAKDIFEGSSSTDWLACYQAIEYANIALDGLKKIKPSPSDILQWNNIRGSALFYRANASYDLAQLFAEPYNKNTVANYLGIPLRLSSDVNIVSIRNSLEQTYNQILTDLNEAKKLLPENALYKTRPSKLSVDALLSRVYLSMQDYDKALLHAGDVLSVYNDLIDFNTINTSPTFTMPNYQADNKEVVFYSNSLSYGIGGYPSLVDTVLYQSYHADDLRRTVFYFSRPAGITFRGNYTGTGATFSGISINEIYLIRAECYARLGNTTEAMNDLNTLLRKRWAVGTFIPLTASNMNEAIKIILTERRKELPFNANLRWQDLRRLNQDPEYAVTIRRELNGEIYTLPPDDDRYVYPIPPDEIRLSGIQQNPR